MIRKVLSHAAIYGLSAQVPRLAALVNIYPLLWLLLTVVLLIVVYLLDTVLLYYKVLIIIAVGVLVLPAFLLVKERNLL